MLHFWDITAVDALDRVVLRFSKLGNQVEVIGMNPQTEALVKKYGKYDNPNFLTMTFGH